MVSFVFDSLHTPYILRDSQEMKALSYILQVGEDDEADVFLEEDTIGGDGLSRPSTYESLLSDTRSEVIINLTMLMRK